MNVANITITYITSDIRNTLFNQSTMNMVDHDIHGDALNDEAYANMQ